MASKKYKYFSYLEWADKDGKKHNIMTQLYKVGLYCIIDGQASQQISTDPRRFSRQQKKHIKELESQGLSYTTGREITASDVSGFWEEVSV